MNKKCSLKCIASRIYLSLLRLKYKFDPWHVSGNIYCRTYKHQVLELVESLGAISSVVEIGCGLGDLVSNVAAPDRVGIDKDKNVIKAAEYLNGGKCRFVSGTFEEASLFKADLLIMVNWIHELAPDIIECNVKKLRSNYVYMLVDAITSNRGEYKYKHQFDFMSAIGEQISRIDCDPTEGRSLLLYKFTTKRQ